MGHKVFIRHTYIYKCSDKKCNEEWKVNEAENLEILHCPYCGKKDNGRICFSRPKRKIPKKMGVKPDEWMIS